MYNALGTGYRIQIKDKDTGHKVLFSGFRIQDRE